MSELTDQEIFERLMDGSDHVKQVTLPTKHGDLDFNLTPLDRDELYDEASKLPGGLVMGMAEAESPEDASQNMGLPDGDGIDAFVQLCVKALEHDTDDKAQKFGDTEIEAILDKAQDEVVFELAAEVVQFSMEVGEIEDFHIDR